MLGIIIERSEAIKTVPDSSLNYICKGLKVAATYLYLGPSLKQNIHISHVHIFGRFVSYFAFYLWVKHA